MQGQIAGTPPLSPRNSASSESNFSPDAQPSDKPTAEVASPVASFRLPIDFDILFHASKEARQKSTAVHAAVLCPDQVKLYDWRFEERPKPGPKRLPDWDPESTVILYPDPNAPTPATLPASVFSRVKRAVVLDSTWPGVRQLLREPSIQHLQKVRLDAAETRFWRPQKGKPDTSLSTIEAMYVMAREFWLRANPGQEYTGEFDNLLFYFAAFHRRISELYAGKTFPGRVYHEEQQQ